MLTPPPPPPEILSTSCFTRGVSNWPGWRVFMAFPKGPTQRKIWLPLMATCSAATQWSARLSFYTFLTRKVPWLPNHLGFSFMHRFQLYDICSEIETRPLWRISNMDTTYHPHKWLFTPLWTFHLRKQLLINRKKAHNESTPTWVWLIGQLNPLTELLCVSC